MRHIPLKYLIASIVAQIAMVVVAHFVPAVLGMTAILGTLIPLIIGLWYGMKSAPNWTWALLGAFIVGIVGALIGVLLSVALGDSAADPIFLTMAPFSSGVTGLIGGAIGFAIGGKNRGG
ncbi:MAG: hypothetical protein AAGN46_03085 [Acidobacteriota bacterium]